MKVEKIEKIIPVSLQLTLEVITERENILKTIKVFSRSINDLANTMVNIKTTYKQIQEMDPVILAMSKYTYQRKVQQSYTVTSCAGTNTTTTTRTKVN